MILNPPEGIMRQLAHHVVGRFLLYFQMNMSPWWRWKESHATLKTRLLCRSSNRKGKRNSKNCINYFPLKLEGWRAEHGPIFYISGGAGLPAKLSTLVIKIKKTGHMKHKVALIFQHVFTRALCIDRVLYTVSKQPHYLLKEPKSMMSKDVVMWGSRIALLPINSVL